MTMQLSFAADVLETLRAIEWVGSTIGHGGECPFCGALRFSGEHTEDCRVARLIARATEEMKERTA